MWAESEPRAGGKVTRVYAQCTVPNYPSPEIPECIFCEIDVITGDVMNEIIATLPQNIYYTIPNSRNL